MALENTLPDILEFTGNSITQGDFKVALNKLILYLNEVLGADGSKAIPSGIICLWSGSVDNIPDGWALCNGENGTEDLRDKFVVGAGRNYAVNATGGNTSQNVNLSGNTGATTLTVNQMPSHTHTFTGSSTTTNSAGGHTHNIGRDTDGGSGSSRYTVHKAGASGAQGTSPTSSAGAHTHTLTPKGKNANTGGGGSHTNLQPYIVCYMWKRTA